MKSITSANAVFLLSVTNLFPLPIRLEGFSADAAFDTDPVEAAEVVRGVDGFMSAGFIPVIGVPQSITMAPDSLSIDIFTNWIEAQKAISDLYVAQGTIILPSVQRKYTMRNGVLSRYPHIPPAHKILQPLQFQITWEDISPSPTVASFF